MNNAGAMLMLERSEDNQLRKKDVHRTLPKKENRKDVERKVWLQKGTDTLEPIAYKQKVPLRIPQVRGSTGARSYITRRRCGCATSLVGQRDSRP